MRYGSVCSGIEAASVAWTPLGWKPAFVAEIEPFCCAVLRHHYPTVPNLGDFTTITGTEDACGAIDLLIAGTPCQSFSVAGRRAGLDDPRGNLTLEYLALIDRLRPRWVVWENVSGVLSDDGGRTFGTILGYLGQRWYGFAYRVCDAQYFGVAQKRRRVFVVGYRGDWRPPAAVLFERASLSGHPTPRRETGEDVAACLTHGVDSQGKGGCAGRRREDDVNLVGYRTSPNCGAWETGPRIDALTTGTDQTSHLVVAACLTSNYGKQLDNSDTSLGPTVVIDEDQLVRRLTPRECERLMGLPDDYTLVPYHGKLAADAPRYRAIGNAFVVPVVRWIGERIVRVAERMRVCS